MPELPDIAAYISALEPRILGQPLLQVRLASPFLLRTADPPLSSFEGSAPTELRRIGKRIAIGFNSGRWMVLHLMVAGRLDWKPAGAKIGARRNLAAFDFSSGTLVLTEAGSKRRAALHLFTNQRALAAIDPGGLEVFEADLQSFRNALTEENHTLKRVLTDPRVLSGIGNAYSDEILHAAQLSPLLHTRKMTAEQFERLFLATRETLSLWTNRLKADSAEKFPEHVTAFRKQMAVHGRYGRPCPRCGHPVQRIRYADNETNYCAYCQTDGKVLADRGMSRLLGDDWPRTLDELEALHRRK